MSLPTEYKPLSVDAIRSLETLGGSVLDETLKACYWQGDYKSVSNAIDAGAFGGEEPVGAKQHDRLCEFLFRKHPDRDIGTQLTFKILGRLKSDPDEMARLLMHGLTRQKEIGEFVHLLVCEGADMHRPVKLIGKDRNANEYDLAIYSPAQAYMSTLISSQVGAFPQLLAEKLDHVPLAMTWSDDNSTGRKSLMTSALEMGRNAISELLFARLDKASLSVQADLDSILEGAYNSASVESVIRLLALGHTPAEPRLWEKLCDANPDMYQDGSLAHFVLRHSGNNALTMTDGRDMVNVALEALLANGLDPNLAADDSLLNLAYRYQNKTAFAMLLEAGADPAPVNSYPVAGDMHKEMMNMAQAMNAKRAVDDIISAARQRNQPEGRA